MKRKLYRVLIVLAVMAGLMGSVTAPALAESGAIEAIVFPDPALGEPEPLVLSSNLAGECAVYTVTFSLGEELPDVTDDYLFVAFPEEATLPTNPMTDTFRIENPAYPSGGLAPTSVEYQGPTVIFAEGENDEVELYKLGLPAGMGEGEWTTVTVGYGGCIVNNPTTAPGPGDEYKLYVKTTEEIWKGTPFEIIPPPVTLWLKRQVPFMDCGYKDLEPILGFQTIQEALDAANAIWMGQKIERTDSYYPRWNLFEGCPSHIPTMPTGAENYGVPVGAVITVAADFDDDGIADVYNEQVTMDTPGVMLGSMPNTTTGVEKAVIDLDGFDLDPADHGVRIYAGGTSFGEGHIAISTSACGEYDQWVDLAGFQIVNVLGDEGDDDGIWADPGVSDKCTVEVPVYDSTAVISGTLSDTGVFTYAGGGDGLIADGYDFELDDKVVNLNTGWSVYVESLDVGDAASLRLTPTGASTVNVANPDEQWYFEQGHTLAVFKPGDWACPDARVEIRDNEIYDAYDDGMEIWNGVFWVDSNYVEGSGEDGINAYDLHCYGVVPCDGNGFAREHSYLLQISKNEVHTSGDGDITDYQCEDPACFDLNGTGQDSGIDLNGTVGPDGELTGTLHAWANHLEANTDAGMLLQGDHDCWIDIQQNTLMDNGVFGLSNRTADPTMVNFKWNDVEGNGYWGVKNWVEMYDLDVTENYFGSPFGPSEGPGPCAHQTSQTSDALGNGDGLSKATIWDPWLTKPFATVLGDGVRWYGSDNIDLAAGWNTLAVPTNLSMDGDTFAEVQAGGQWLDGVMNALYFDGALQQWDTPTSIKTGEGYFVRMSHLGASQFPVLYNGEAGPVPSFPVYEGWNLVGSMFGVDEEVDMMPYWDVFADSKDKDMALDSIGDVASVVFSPAVNGTPWSEIYDGNTGTGNHMDTGRAYWVYATDEANLAGFHVTPFFFSPGHPLIQ